jgi:hypothetical protein
LIPEALLGETGFFERMLQDPAIALHQPLTENSGGHAIVTPLPFQLLKQPRVVDTKPPGLRQLEPSRPVVHLFVEKPAQISVPIIFPQPTYRTPLLGQGVLQSKVGQVVEHAIALQ